MTLEFKKFESIEELEAFISSEEDWEYGVSGMTTGLLLEEYVRLRVFYRMIENITGIMGYSNWEERLEEYLEEVSEDGDQLAGAVEAENEA